MELTVAEVSGLIAAGVFVLQILIPLAIPWALTAFLSQENSIITWTALGRFLHSSLWPSILGSSTAETAGVPWRVFLSSWGQTILLFILSVAAICSPLGLYTSIEAASSYTERPFHYITDNSSFGYGTPSRGPGPFTRVCGLEIPCPGSSLNTTCETMGLVEVCNNTVYESRIPPGLMRIYNEGAEAFGPTVSSIFDMQYRTYRNSTDPYSSMSWYTKPDYRTMSVLLLEEDIRPVEGLIVDLQDGGIGFRNHTAPESSPKYGATWTEDILFIEPETQCVPLNLSIHAVTPPFNYNKRTLDTLTLVDEGGFSNLARAGPEVTRTGVINGQGHLDLRDRAFKAGWVNNYYTMRYLNITDADPGNITRLDSVTGQRFNLSDGASGNFTIGFSSIQTNIFFGSYLNLTTSENRTFNPHGVTSMHFNAASTTCGGTTYASGANINSSLIACGLVIGAATRTDGGSDLILDPDSPWKFPLYSCATAMKAVVKTVELQYNGTGLGALEVRSLTSKQYDSSASIPVWGVEDITEHTIDEAPPMWGIIGPNTTDLGTLAEYNISSLSSETLYLPGYMDVNYPLLRGPSSMSRRSGQNLPGVEFYNQALLTAYTVDAYGFDAEADYSGSSSLSLYAKWQTLARSAGGAASIINLIWTDVAANAVVGTKGWGLSAAASRMAIPSVAEDASTAAPISTPTSVPVIVYASHIRYHLPFAVPAFITLGLTMALLVLLIVLLVQRRTGIKRLKSLLESTTVGRLLWPFIETTETTDNATATQWIQSIGGQKVTITADVIEIDGKPLGHRRLLNEPEQEVKDTVEETVDTVDTVDTVTDVPGDHSA
ncbi:hypothetical protein BJX99DRAFT_272595 [Aspergillus californicus]